MKGVLFLVVLVIAGAAYTQGPNHETALIGEGIATGTLVRYEGTYCMFYTNADPQTTRLVKTAGSVPFVSRCSIISTKLFRINTDI